MHVRTVLLLVCAAAALRGDSITDLKQSCSLANLGTGKYWLIECLQQIFTAYPAHVKMGTIAPGAGTLALGPTVSEILPINRTEIDMSASALLSTDTSWLLQGQAVFAIPAFGHAAHSGRRAGERGLLSEWAARRAQLDADSSLTLRARVLDVKEQWYYGLGPSTSLSGLSKYSQKEADVEADYNYPLADWNAVGLNAGFLHPRVAAPNSGISIQSTYNAVTAPGLDLHDDFLRFEPYFTLRLPPRRSMSSVVHAGFSFYHDAGDQRFSFDRLSVSDISSIPLRIPSAGLAPTRGRAANFFCPSSRSGKHCSAGELALIGRLDATYTAGVSQAPFFFDPTLGGQDFQGNDTLRGFGDYRFRGPDRVLLQAEYRHPIWAVFGLVVFYDVGKVSLTPSDLALDHLRHDIGLGLEISVENHPIARLYVAFGSGEPVQVQPRFGSLL